MSQNFVTNKTQLNLLYTLVTINAILRISTFILQSLNSFFLKMRGKFSYSFGH